MHLKINSEADTEAGTGEPEVLDSLVEGPNDGFPTDACDANIPAEFDDAVCFDGQWIEFAWLDDPTFWECGEKPADSQYSICDPKTGHWTEPTQHSNLDDEIICGELPDGMGYSVCNHLQGTWMPFHAPDEADFVICGEKPAELGMSICNHTTEAWEQAGTLKHPDQPMCGPKPKNLNDTALCDGTTGEWFEVDDTPEPPFASCSGTPPTDVDFAVCNTETG